MNIDKVKEVMKQNIDEKYREFSLGLNPDATNKLGVRIPILRKIAKVIVKEEYKEFLDSNDFSSHELLILQGIVIGLIKYDIDASLKYLDEFIPRVKDWEVNDLLCSSFKIAKSEQKRVWEYL